MATRRRPVQAIPSAGVLEVPSGSGMHQHHHDLCVTSLTRPEQGSVTITVHYIGIGSMLWKNIDRDGYVFGLLAGLLLLYSPAVGVVHSLHGQTAMLHVMLNKRENKAT